MSGEVRRRRVAPRPGAPEDAGSPTGLDDASTLERTAERIGEALRQQPVDDAAEQAAAAAFRSVRAAGDRAPRTRRRDDWRSRTQKQRWARGTAVALVTSALLGGIAFASIRATDTQHHTPDPGTSHSTRWPPAHPPGEQGSPSAGPSTPPTTSAQHPDTAKDVEAHCRAYERIKNRGHALDATAWQRLVQAAGGEQYVAAYCARLTSSADEATPSPTKAHKTGKDQGKPTGKAKPSKKSSTQP